MADRASQIKKILAEGGNVNQQNEQGRTYLHEAAQLGDSQLVEYLLSVGADINATDKDGKTPTDLADAKGHNDLSLELRALGGIREETSAFTPSAHVDLASEKIGGKVLWTNDEWFAAAENLIKPGRGTFQFGVFTDKGQLMDGWESARHGAIKRGGRDSCYIKLGAPGLVRGFDIDTNNFTGNYAAAGSVDAIFSTKDLTVEELHNAQWIEILPKTKLGSSSQHFVPADLIRKCSHIRFHMYPDGGVARLRVYGDPIADWSSHETIELSSIKLGGKVISVSDNYFSSQDNALMPNRGINMGDGWETRRSRIPGNKEWILIKLAHAGNVTKIEVDTHHFKGNYPDSVKMEGCFGEGGEWKELLPREKLTAHNQHYFEAKNIGTITHVRVTIFPDGGISRIRLNGKISSVEEIKKLVSGVFSHSVKSQSLKDEDFINYGEVFTSGNSEGKESWRGKLVSERKDVAPQFFSVKYNKQNVAPFSVHSLEKHSYSSQTFIPMSNSKYLLLVALPSKYADKPDMFHFNAFVVSPGQVVNIKPGVWHSKPVPIDGDAEFLVLAWETGAKNETQYAELPAKINVTV